MEYKDFLSKVYDYAYSTGDYEIIDILPTIVFDDTLVETMGTNSHNIFVNSSWIDTLTIPEIVGTLVHEIFHDVYGHTNAVWKLYDRNSGLTEQEWYYLANIAEDIVINDLVASFNYQLPTGGAFRSSIDVPDEMKTSNEIFDYLKEAYLKDKQQQTDKFKAILDAMRQLKQQDADDQAVSGIPMMKPNSEDGSAAPVSFGESGQQDVDSDDSSTGQSDAQTLQQIKDKLKELQSELSEMQEESTSTDTASGDDEKGSATGADGEADDIDGEQDEDVDAGSADSDEGDLDSDDSDDQHFGSKQDKESDIEEEIAQLEKEQEELEQKIAQAPDSLTQPTSAGKGGSAGGSSTYDSSLASSADSTQFDEVKLQSVRDAAASLIQLTQPDLKYNLTQTKPANNPPLAFKSPKKTWVEQALSYVAGALLSDQRDRTFARPGRRPGMVSPSGIVTPSKGYRTTDPLPRAQFYIDCSGSMGNTPELIRKELYRHKSILGRTQSTVVPFDDYVGEPIDISMEMPYLGGGTDINRVISDINDTDGVDVFVVVTDAYDTFDLTRLAPNKVLVLVTNHPEEVSGQQARPNVKVIGVKEF